MPPWLESHADLRDHPKVDMLMDLLAITRRDGIGLLHMVWWRALVYAPSGDLSDFTDGQIARWADWDGDSGHLVSALRTAGFIDSSRTLHDWDEYAGRWIDRRKADAERKRSARAAASPGVNGTSGGHPPGRRPESGVPDLNGPDLNRTGHDRTPTTPPPPPPAEGERQTGAKKVTAEVPMQNPGRRSGRRRGEPSSAPSPEVTAPLTPADELVWGAALLDASQDMSAANADMLAQLQPVGRSADGAMLLRAPPGYALERFRGTLARALLDAGDGNGPHVMIFEE